MTDLNVSVIAKFIDRLSGPAKKSAQALTGLVTAQKASSKAAGQAAKDDAELAKASSAAAKATATLGAAAKAAASANAASAKAAKDAAVAQTDLERSTNQAANAAETSYRKFSLLEKSQYRARAASRLLGTQMDQLQGKLAKLGMASLAINTLGQAGDSIMRPIAGSVRAQAAFERRMTGIGIVGDLGSSELSSVRSNIFRNASSLGMPIDAVQQDDMAVLNEGVYRRPGDLNAASRAAAKISLLSDISDSPISGSEAGALISTYAHTLSLPAAQIDQYNAMLFRASQLGGDRIGDVARFMPTVMAQMKGRAFGNRQGFIDAVTAFQIVKRVAGNDEAAGTDLQDLMANLNHRLTKRRFAKAGIDLDKVIVSSEAKGMSPLEGVINALRSKIGDNPKDPLLASKLGEFFMNQQAAQAALALLQYKNDGPQGLGFDHMRQVVGNPSAQANYDSAVNRASSGPAGRFQAAQNAKDQLAISTGTVLQPATVLAAKAMGGLANAMTTVEQKGGLLGKAAVYGATGFGLLTVGVAKVGQGLVGMLATSLIVKELFGKSIPVLFKLAGARVVAFAAEAVPAMWAFTVALLANPLTWIVLGVVAAVAALGVGAFLLIKNWSTVKTWMGGFWEWVKTSVDQAWTKLKSFFTWKPPAWLGAIAAVAAMNFPGGGAVTAAAAAIASSRPAQPPGGPHSGAPGAGGPQVTVHQTNHFHGVSADKPDELAKHMDKATSQAWREALHDGADYE